jgi:polysaccharide pyruvyl transferase WcaK-like protein
MRVLVIGNFSGRNAGDAAILEGLLEDLTRNYRGLEFIIPSINPGFVRNAYERYPVRPVSLLPWNLSLKIFGLPILWSVLSADLILVTDAILFDLKLFNPLYNYLSTLSLVLPMAKKRGIPVVLYNVSLGPANTGMGKKCLLRVLRSSDKIIVRDGESLKLLDTLGFARDGVILAADCALGVPPASPVRVDEILKKEGILQSGRNGIGFNISTYIDMYVRKKSRRLERDRFIQIIARTIDWTVEKLDAEIAFVITQPMDLKIAGEALALLRRRDRVKLISNRTYTHGEISGVLSRMEMHVGMRTHSLILASAQCTPVVGIIATPKNRGYMMSIGQGERMVEFGDGFDERSLREAIASCWESREKIREDLKVIIEKERKKARASALLLKDYIPHPPEPEKQESSRERKGTESSPRAPTLI